MKREEVRSFNQIVRSMAELYKNEPNMDSSEFLKRMKELQLEMEECSNAEPAESEAS